MAWHISAALMKAYENSHYLPGQGVESSGVASSDGAPSAPSSGSPTPQAYLSPDRMTAFSRLSRFGMTFAPLTDDLGEELLTWFRADFPVRTSAPQAEGPDSTANARASGGKWRESLAKFDPDSRSWKTRQFSLLGDSEPFSETWPRWGMTADGESFRLPTPERHTSGNGSGFWPTARTRGMLGGSGSREMVQSLVESGKLSEAEAVRMLGVKLYPTPTASEYGTNQGGSAGRTGPVRPSLSTLAKKWPTPVANDSKKALAFDETNPRNGLSGAVKTFPTPKARDWKRAGGTRKSPDLSSFVRGGMRTPPTYPTPTKSDGLGGPGTSGRQGGENFRTNIGGQLNPEWVEWLMNWPIGWTSLDPLPKENFDDWKFRTQGGSEDIQSGEMRVMWWDNDPAETPYRPQSFEQRKDEHQDSLSEVPRGRAHGSRGLGDGPGSESDLCDMRDGVSTQEETPVEAMRESLLPEGNGKIIGRVAMGIKARVDRLKAIGNGQVSVVAAIAFTLLSGVGLEHEIDTSEVLR